MADLRRAVVIGAGPAGLVAARDLLKRGYVVTVLEAGAAPGGRVSPVTLADPDRGDLQVDAGAESFATRGSVVAELARELGLTVVLPSGASAWVVGPGRAYPLPSTGWLGIPTQPLDREVRAVVGAAAAVHASLEQYRPLGDIADDVTVGSLVRSRMGDEITDRLVAPVLQGVYSRPLDALELRAIDPDLPRQVREAGSLTAVATAKRASAPAGTAVQGIDGGVFRLAAALADAVRAEGGTIVTRAHVERLELRDGAWHLLAGGGTVVADLVVVATTRGAATRLIPKLGAVGERSASEGMVSLVTLLLDAPDLDSAPRGTGVLAIEGVTRAKALTHSTAKWPWLARAAAGRHVVRLSYAIDVATHEHRREDVASHALADATRLLGVELAPSQLRAEATVTWTDAAPQATSDLNPAPGLFLVGSAAGLTGLASIVGADFPWAAGEATLEP